MKLTKKQISEIVACDLAARKRDTCDARHYGSLTDSDSITQAKEHYTRRTLRYGYIVPDRSREPKRRGITVCHVAVRLAKDFSPRVKVVSQAHIGGSGCKTILAGAVVCNMYSGWNVTWYGEDFDEKSRRQIDVTNYKGWWKSPYGKYPGLVSPFPPTINPEVLADTRYRWCAWRPECGIALVDYLHLYDKEPKIEFLAKANLFGLISIAGIAALRRSDFMEWVKDNMKELAGIRFKVRDALFAHKHGVSLAAAIRHFDFVREIRRDISYNLRYCGDKKPRLHLDYVRLRRLLPKWRVSKTEYARYLREAISYGLDPRCEGVLYPPVRDGRKTFMERLEKLEAENTHREKLAERRRRYAERKARKAAAEERARKEKEERAYARSIMASRLAEIADFQKSVDRIRHINVAGCTCVIAKSQSELLKEGRRMGNCVGDGRYGKGTVMGDTLILMFRDKNGKSWCDAEIDRSNWRINQCYLKGNDTAPQEMHDLAATIAKELHKVHVKHRKAHIFPDLERRRISA